jgi:hypothetical protein
VEHAIGSIKNIRESRWTERIAVGCKPFVNRVKSVMGAMPKGRKIRDGKDGFELRKETAANNAVLGIENCNIA